MRTNPDKNQPFTLDIGKGLITILGVSSPTQGVSRIAAATWEKTWAEGRILWSGSLKSDWLISETIYKQTCKIMPAARISSFLKGSQVKSRLDADTKNGWEGDLREHLLLSAWYRLVWVEPAVDEKTHLHEKEGKAGDIHTFKKARQHLFGRKYAGVAISLQQQNFCFNIAQMSLNVLKTFGQYWSHNFNKN